MLFSYMCNCPDIISTVGTGMALVYLVLLFMSLPPSSPYHFSQTKLPNLSVSYAREKGLVGRREGGEGAFWPDE